MGRTGVQWGTQFMSASEHASIAAFYLRAALISDWVLDTSYLVGFLV